MEQDNPNFDPLLKLLALKKHEQPPPRYFNEFSSNVISRIRAQRSGLNTMQRLESEAPWLLRLWQAVASKPSVAWGVGAAVSALVLGGILLAEKPATQPQFAGPSATPDNTGLVAGQPVESGVGLNQPVLISSSNASPVSTPNLFDMFQPPQTAPVSARP